MINETREKNKDKFFHFHPFFHLQAFLDFSLILFCEMLDNLFYVKPYVKPCGKSRQEIFLWWSCSQLESKPGATTRHTTRILISSHKSKKIGNHWFNL